MDRDDLNALVVENTGRRDKVNQIDGYLNFALLNLSQLHPFDQLRSEVDASITTGDIQAGLPSDLDQIVELRLVIPGSPTLSYPMNLRRKTYFVEKFPNIQGTVVTGRPVECYRDGNTLFLDRKSNGTYVIRMTQLKMGSFLSGDDSSPVTNADETLVAYATAAVYKSIQGYSDAQFWMGEYGRCLKALVDAKSRELGVIVQMQEVQLHNRVTSSQPWLDPWAGQSIAEPRG